MSRPIKNNIEISKIIREMINQSSYSQEDIAEVLGKNLPTFRNKLSKGTFSIEELVSIASITNNNIVIGRGNNEYYLKAEDICDSISLNRIQGVKEKVENRKIEMLENAFRMNDAETIKHLYNKYISDNNMGKQHENNW